MNSDASPPIWPPPCRNPNVRENRQNAITMAPREPLTASARYGRLSVQFGRLLSTMERLGCMSMRGQAAGTVLGFGGNAAAGIAIRTNFPAREALPMLDLPGQ